ncbi:MAG: hypothetical protein QM730_01085 [Anaerolineales bacterium]
MKKLYFLLLLALILTACQPQPEAANIPVPIETFTPALPNRIETETPKLTSTAIHTKTLNVGDGGLLSGQPCESPCFYGIRIGETAIDQVVSTLKENGISPCYEIVSGTGIPDDNNRSFFGCGIDGWNVIVNHNDRETIVDGIIYDLSIQISVGDVIDKYGEPDFVEVTQGYITRNDVAAFLYWDVINMAASLPILPETEGEIYNLENSTIIKGIGFYSDEDYLDYSRESSIPWHGYGVYKP